MVTFVSLRFRVERSGTPNQDQHRKPDIIHRITDTTKAGKTNLDITRIKTVCQETGARAVNK